MKGIGKTAVFGDFLDGKPGVCQLVGGNAKASLIQIMRRRGAVTIPKEFKEMLARDTGSGGQIHQGQVASKLFEDELLRPRQGLAPLADHGCSVMEPQRKAGQQCQAKIQMKGVLQI